MFWQKLSLYFRYKQFQQSLRQLHVSNIESSRCIQAATILSDFQCVSIDNTHWMRIDAYLCTPIMIVLTTSSILCNAQCSVTRSFYFFTLVVFLESIHTDRRSDRISYTHFPVRIRWHHKYDLLNRYVIAVIHTKDFT